jgi:hypothetical protein
VELRIPLFITPLVPLILRERDCTLLEKEGTRFASSMSNLKIRMGCAQLALGADVGIHAGTFAHPDAL